MPDITHTIRQLARTLPELQDGSFEVTFKYEREGVPRYRITLSDGSRLLLKHYTGNLKRGSSEVERGAKELSGAEAIGLREFAPLGLAPGLVWHGELPGEPGGYGVIYRRVEGIPADRATLTEVQARRLSDVLWEVHSRPPDLKLIAPHPRNLHGWWNRVHEQYRDLPPDFISSLPPAVEEAITRLIQSVSGDANAHIRFWQGSTLVPVHGNPAMHNVIVDGAGVVLVDWSRFGLGDRAFEVANAVWEMALSGSESLVDDLTGPYFRRADDVMLERRVLIYRRLLPFGRFLDVLHRHWHRDTLGTDAALHATRYLTTAMAVYGHQPHVIEAAESEFAMWLREQVERESAT